MSKQLTLSFTEFEILQQLVRSGAKSLAQLNSSQSTLNSSEIKDSTEILIKKGFVDFTGNKLIANTEARSALEPYRVKRAVILAAGRGLRMQPATDNNPKPMMLINDKHIIETQIDALLAAGIADITIVRGYMSEAFDSLLADYASVKFIDNHDWSSTEAIVSTQLAVDLLSRAYLIEGDLYINNPDVIRPYEYRSSYCGTPGLVNDDWFYCADNEGLLEKLKFGDSSDDCNNPHRFIGIMFWESAHAKQLKVDLKLVTQNPENQHRFVESVPFDPQSSEYDIYARSLGANEVIEVDTYKEILDLRFKVKNSSD